MMKRQKKENMLYSKISLGMSLVVFVFVVATFIQSQNAINNLNNAADKYTNEYNRLISMGQYNNCNVATKISRGDILLKNNSFEIEVPSRELALLEFANVSFSMSPTVSPLNHAVAFVPQSEFDIHVCDVISYYDGQRNVFHRVMSIEHDQLGTYYVVKGDNNTLPDDEKVRFSSVNYVMLAIIY
jgi:hypothetical protein